MADTYRVRVTGIVNGWMEQSYQLERMDLF